MGSLMTRNNRIPSSGIHRGVMPGAWCKHAYPIEVSVYDNGRRARCLRCRGVGSRSADAYIARRALLEEGHNRYLPNSLD